ncbi:copper amine oxidase domain protein [Alkaliphilus metalliredigens QYMF]|uniref:Copper amine oxidase domain protein n=1 Tax=Alkaliphilus metalliredigens (strain QYMF) TaxID=293826 RepID=A6TUQ3_ALKMQ|nr:stalk domain-containing protein [Alkaliphilus metalliredigens]ABR49921.1 copper amine oxidase domain protein [Alkaliphilus metalliredigens QYMF]
MKKKQRLALVIILTLVLSVIAPAGLPMYADAASISSTDYTFDISGGNITLASGTGEYTGKIAVTHGSVTQHVYADDTITITGTTTTNRVLVSSGVTANITLSNVDISRTSINQCAFDMSGATINLTLIGNNSLSSGLMQAGLKVPAGAVLTINGSGRLTAKSVVIGSSSAGIGGGWGQDAGTINILGGTVTAMGGNSGAGIGGGGRGVSSGGYGGAINISGGIVTATGGDYGAGIGGGFEGSGGIINISGGTVTAVGGSSGAGIGGGPSGGSGTINISGNAQITATGGGPIMGRQNGWDIGSGSGSSGTGTLKIAGDGNDNPTVVFTTYGTNALVPTGVEKPYTNCTIQGAGAKDKKGIDIAGVYGPEGKEQAHLIITGVPTNMTVNETFDLSSSVTGGSTTGAITYSVTGSGLTVENESIVTAVQVGTATITVTKEGDKYFSSVLAIIGNIIVTEPVTLERIRVTSQPDKVIYYVNETLDLTGLVVTGEYSDTSTASLSVTAANISGFNSSVEKDNQVITVTYENKITTFTVDIVTPLIPTINPASMNYELTTPADVFTIITWGNAVSVTDVMYGSENLVLDTDYTINVNQLTIYTDYLEALNLRQGDRAEFNIFFDDNNIVTLTVNAVEGYIPSGNAKLMELLLSQGTLNPTFSEDIVSYSANVGSGISSMNVTTVIEDSNATVAINGNSVASGSVIPISLNTGNNTITIVVTAENGSIKTYTIIVNRASSNAGGSINSSSRDGSSTQNLAIVKTNPTEAIEGIAYSYSFIATGGGKGYSFKITSGALPEGLTLSKDGVISGTPTKAGTYQYTITVTDQNGRVVRHSFTQVIGEEVEEEIQKEPLEKEDPPKKQIRLTLGRLETQIDDEIYLLDTIPFIEGESNRTLVPIKFISEALGAKVTWLSETEQVLIIEGETEILLTIGSKEVLVNGEIILIETEPRIMSPGRTFVPLRFVSEILGATVEYDEVTREITIIK